MYTNWKIARILIIQFDCRLPHPFSLIQNLILLLIIAIPPDKIFIDFPFPLKIIVICVNDNNIPGCFLLQINVIYIFTFAQLSQVTLLLILFGFSKCISLSKLMMFMKVLEAMISNVMASPSGPIWENGWLGCLLCLLPTPSTNRIQFIPQVSSQGVLETQRDNHRKRDKNRKIKR